MPARRSRRLLILVIYALIGIGSSHTTVASPGTTASMGMRLLSNAILGRPVVTERAVFWKEIHGQRTLIRGYDLNTGTPFAIAERTGVVLDLAADDTLLAWVERDIATSRLGIVGYDLQAHAAFPILSFAGRPPLSEIALDRGTLYYTDSTADHRGLFARSLVNGSERLISQLGMRPLARDGVLLWSEARVSGPVGRAIWTLHLRTADERHGDTVIAEREAGYLGFSGYDLSGDVVVWAFARSAGDSRVHIHRISAGATTIIASTAASDPHIRGDTIVWATAEPNWTVTSRVRVFNLSTHAQSLVVEVSGAVASIWGIVGQERVALTIASDPSRGVQALYLGDLRVRNVRFAASQATIGAVPSACNPAVPATCGQVRLADGVLYDAGGPWHAKGVQFILPQFGINAKTFRTENYAAAGADGSLDYWLDKAQHYLRANVLRIFVDLPYRGADGTLVTPSDYPTLFDFAARANARGMRLAISLHNSADWALSGDRAGWIAGLLDYFGARDRLALIAYLSADNEINNHCGRDGRDCFDSDGQYNAQLYIDGAVGWVAQFRTVVKRRAPELLLTVGVSTEMADADGTRGAFNFFYADSSGRSLASQVDFLAPHNYGGGASGIVDDLRYAGYAGPVVLEEYGYPSDPYPRSPYWTEGPRICRVDPEQPVCALTAPFFVEENIHALRTKSYAGSIAWMLADMREKDTSSACGDPEKTFDLWTGLFAIGGTYCDGGTYSRAWGQPKATAVRVCAYYADDLALCEPGVSPKHKIYFPLVAQR